MPPIDWKALLLAVPLLERLEVPEALKQFGKSKYHSNVVRVPDGWIFNIYPPEDPAQMTSTFVPKPKDWHWA